MKTTGTQSEQLIQCSCDRLLSVTAGVGTQTPNTRITGIVFAYTPCLCGRTVTTLFKFGGQQ